MEPDFIRRRGKPRAQMNLKCGHQGGKGFCFGPEEPDFLAGISFEKRKNVLIDADLCIINERRFFIRGCLDLPIIGTSSSFTWLVWVSLSRRNFDRAVDLWETPGRETEPPYFGWLNTRLPGYPNTSKLKTHVQTLPVGKRPLVLLESTSHPLALEQRKGITVERAESLARHVLLEWS